MNSKNMKKAVETVSKMTLEEKAGMCSGQDCWTTKSVERLGIKSIMLSDGPHGLRKQIDATDNLGIGKSAPATCFPTASLLACSFDTDLAFRVGEAIGEECIKEGVSVLLGPGINIKRSPLCGRNFEYYSEDPYLSGKMAAGFIKGVQSTGTFACLKHFAVNNQEKRRMLVNAVVDKRALHELYLKGFEIAVKDGEPRALMCSYNKVNGDYASENKYLLDDVLRKRWGYKGLVVSDWGAVHDRTEGVKAGLDLEMPGNLGVNDAKLIKAYEDGSLTAEALDKAAANVCGLVFDASDVNKENKEFDRDAHHALAVEAAASSMVLLKNEHDILPLSAGSTVIIGTFAKTPRYQGAGSSKVNPFCIDSPIECLKKEFPDLEYICEYDPAIAAGAVCQKDNVIIFAGLPEDYESEGFDRENMDLPKEQNRLIEEVVKVNPNVTVILMGGSPVKLPWADKIPAILLSYLAGEGVGTALTEIITGKTSPSGKLAETWPVKESDVPCAKYFPGDRDNVLYKEGIYTGYRYYDTFNIEPLFSFGHGLGYSAFSYDIKRKEISLDYKEKTTVSFDVTNIGSMDASEISFIFASHENKTVFMPKKTLIGFKKEKYLSGETKNITIEIDTCDLAYFNTLTDDFHAEPGIYHIYAGGSMDTLKEVLCITLNSEEIQQPDVKYDDFEGRLGYSLPFPALPRKRPFTSENCLMDASHTLTGKMIIAAASKMMGDVESKEEGQSKMMNAALMEMPLYALQASSAGMLTERMCEGIVDILNLHILRGLAKFIKP
ncbi:MAG: beta-glucosidase [Lachnospiraceae bacterium]|nr:beta-glucosidase [Lachnospiraceae bacterium]